MAAPAESPAELVPLQWGQPAPISGDLQPLPADSPFNFAISSSGLIRWVDPRRVEAEFGVEIPSGADLSYQVAPALPATRPAWPNVVAAQMAPLADSRPSRPSLVGRFVDQALGTLACGYFLFMGMFDRGTPPRPVADALPDAPYHAPWLSTVIASSLATTSGEEVVIPGEVRFQKPRSSERIGQLDGIALGARMRLRSILLAGVEQSFIDQCEAGTMATAQQHAHNVLRAAELSQPMLRIAYMLNMPRQHRAALLQTASDDALLARKAGQEPLSDQPLSLEAWLTIAFADLGELDIDEFEAAARGALMEMSALAARYQQLRTGDPDFPDLHPPIPLPNDDTLARLAAEGTEWEHLDAVRAAAEAEQPSITNATGANSLPRCGSVPSHNLLPEAAQSMPAQSSITPLQQPRAAWLHSLIDSAPQYVPQAPRSFRTDNSGGAYQSEASEPTRILSASLDGIAHSETPLPGDAHTSSPAIAQEHSAQAPSRSSVRYYRLEPRTGVRDIGHTLQFREMTAEQAMERFLDRISGRAQKEGLSPAELLARDYDFIIVEPSDQ